MNLLQESNDESRISTRVAQLCKARVPGHVLIDQAWLNGGAVVWGVGWVKLIPPTKLMSNQGCFRQRRLRSVGFI